MNQWLKKAVIYHILLDRFAGYDEKQAADWDCPVFIGGNLLGVINSLPYLQKLNITALWLSPFCKTVEYHGYHVTDYFTVDPHFGDFKDLEQLTTKCHKHNIRVIADFVPNHCHETHPYFVDALQQDSKRRNWFFFDAENRPMGFLDAGYLPKFNLDNPETQKHIIDSALKWLKAGIDGLRLDHVIGVSTDFLKALSEQTKKEFPESVLFGEAVIDLDSARKYHNTLHLRNQLWRRWFGFTQERLQRDYIGLLDGVLDFEFAELVRRYVKGQLTRTQLNRRLKRHFTRYPETFSLVLFLDNHDKDRLLFECGGDVEKVREAFKIMFMAAQEYNQSLVLYYGSEILMEQRGPITKYPHADVLARKAMNWHPGEFQRSFYDFCAEQAHRLRKRKLV